MATKLSYVIEFVADMDRAVKFYRDTIGLVLRFESPGWSEFSTGHTTLGLHPATPERSAGVVQIGLHVADPQKFYEEMRAKGVKFVMAPKIGDIGAVIARFEDTEGAMVSVMGT